MSRKSDNSSSRNNDNRHRQLSSGQRSSILSSSSDKKKKEDEILKQKLKLELSKITIDNYLQYTLKYLMIPPQKRKPQEIQLLLKSTSYLSFFKKMQEIEAYREKQVHMKCCQKMCHVFANKGEPVIKIYADADRFFVTLKGSVLIWIPRGSDSVMAERNLAVKLKDFLVREKHVQKIFEQSMVDIDPNEFVNLKNGFSDDDIKICKNWETYTFNKIRDPKHNNYGKGRIEYNNLFIAKELKGVRLADLEKQNTLFDSVDGILMFKCVATLGKGSIFGEKGLDEGAKRNATVMCQHDCHFGVIYKEDYVRILKEVSLSIAEKQKNFIQTQVIGGGMDSDVCAAISFDFFKQKIEVRKNTVLFRRGQVPDFVYIIFNGTVTLYWEDLRIQDMSEKFEHRMLITRKERHQFDIAVLNEGAILGDLFFIKQTKKNWRRPFSAVCASDAVLLKVTVSCYHARMMRFPKFEVFVIKRVNNICKTNMKMLEQKKASREEQQHLQRKRRVDLTKVMATIELKSGLEWKKPYLQSKSSPRKESLLGEDVVNRKWYKGRKSVNISSKESKLRNKYGVVDLNYKPRQYAIKSGYGGVRSKGRGKRKPRNKPRDTWSLACKNGLRRRLNRIPPAMDTQYKFESQYPPLSELSSNKMRKSDKFFKLLTNEEMDGITKLRAPNIQDKMKAYGKAQLKRLPQHPDNRFKKRKPTKPMSYSVTSIKGSGVNDYNLRLAKTVKQSKHLYKHLRRLTLSTEDRETRYTHPGFPADDSDSNLLESGHKKLTWTERRSKHSVPAQRFYSTFCRRQREKSARKKPRMLTYESVELDRSVQQQSLDLDESMIDIGISDASAYHDDFRLSDVANASGTDYYGESGRQRAGDQIQFVELEDIRRRKQQKSLVVHVDKNSCFAGNISRMNGSQFGSPFKDKEDLPYLIKSISPTKHRRSLIHKIGI